MSSIALISRPEPDPWVPTGPFATPSATSMAPLDWVLASRSTCNSRRKSSSSDLHPSFKADAPLRPLFLSRSHCSQIGTLMIATDQRTDQPVRRVVQAATCYPDNSLGGDHDCSSDAFGAELAVGCGWPVLDSQCPRRNPEPYGVRGTACASYPAAAHPGDDVCAFVVAIAAGGAARKTFRSRSSCHS